MTSIRTLWGHTNQVFGFRLLRKVKMELPSYFIDFLSAIRPTDPQKEDYKRGHKTLRERLNTDKTLTPILISDFLQGSYRRATAIRQVGEKRSDVDLIIVTSLSEREKPVDAMARFVP